MTPKQKAFVLEYMKDLNATQSAIRAGYSEATAYSQGQRMLKNVEVSTAIAAAQAERAKECGIDALWVLKKARETFEAALKADNHGAAVSALKLVGTHVDVQAFKEQRELSGSLNIGNALDQLDD